MRGVASGGRSSLELVRGIEHDRVRERAGIGVEIESLLRCGRKQQPLRRASTLGGGRARELGDPSRAVEVEARKTALHLGEKTLLPYFVVSGHALRGQSAIRRIASDVHRLPH